MVKLNHEFWQNKRVLVTGHTGFKGGWLILLLERLGSQVIGASIDDHKGKSFYSETDIGNRIESQLFDLRDQDRFERFYSIAKPDIVLHLAAQALVLDGYSSPHETFSTNFTSTLNILEAIKNTPGCKTVVVVTTDKVYENDETSRAFVESDRLGGFDPYSASKSATELLIQSYRESFLREAGVSVVSVRAGNVIGGGDFTRSRLLPDIYHAWVSGNALLLRNPHSTRPWQHVLEPLTGYLLLAEKAFKNTQLSGGFNFGPKDKELLTVSRIIEMASDLLGPIEQKIESSTATGKEARRLELNSNKVRELLNFEAQWSVEESIKKTLEWYQKYDSGECAESLCINDLNSYGHV